MLHGCRAHAEHGLQRALDLGQVGDVVRLQPDDDRRLFAHEGRPVGGEDRGALGPDPLEHQVLVAGQPGVEIGFGPVDPALDHPERPVPVEGPESGEDGVGVVGRRGARDATGGERQTAARPGPDQ